MGRLGSNVVEYESNGQPPTAKTVNIESDHDSATSDHSADGRQVDDLRIENDDYRQKIDLMKICLSQKDLLIQSLDAKNRQLESQAREGEKVMQDWIADLKKTIMRLEVGSFFMRLV